MTEPALLSSAQLYRQDIAPYALDASHREELNELARRAQMGDPQAREALLLGLQDYVHYWAGRFARAYAWASARIDSLELISIGTLAMVEKFAFAMEHENACAVLAATAKFAMWNFCKRYASPITTPDRAEPITVTSLDRPLRRRSDGAEAPLTLADLLPASTSAHTGTPQACGVSDEQLYTTLAELPERQRRALERYYGLGEHAPERLCQIRKDIGKEGQAVTHEAARDLVERALTRLRKGLGVPVAPVSRQTMFPAEGDPGEVYTSAQARAVLGLENLHTFYATLSKHGIRRAPTYGTYPKSAIDALAELRRQRKNKPVVGGSVYPRKTGGWAAQFKDATTGTYKMLYARTEPEARAKLEQALAQQRTSRHNAQEVTA